MYQAQILMHETNYQMHLAQIIMHEPIKCIRVRSNYIKCITPIIGHTELLILIITALETSIQ